MSEETWIFEIEGIPVPIHARTKTQALMAKRYIEALAKERKEKEQNKNERTQDNQCSLEG